MLFDEAGNRLRLLRIKDGLTQEKLAEKLDVSHNSISAIETGSRNGTLHFYKKAAEYFNVGVNYFFFEDISANDNVLMESVIIIMSRMDKKDQQLILNILKEFDNYKRNN